MAQTGSGDPARRRTGWTGNVWVNDYYPEWLDNLADDATLEAPAMNGSAHGAEAVRAIVVEARKLYEFQDFNLTGHYTATTASSRATLLGPRRAYQRHRHGHPQHRREGPAHRGEPPATQLAAALLPSDA